MSEPQRELPRYRSHKTVGALKIADITALPEGRARITPAEEGYEPFEVEADYVRKHEPKAGGYFILYQDSDNYKSWSPAEAFEGGYTRV